MDNKLSEKQMQYIIKVFEDLCEVDARCKYEIDDVSMDVEKGIVRFGIWPIHQREPGSGCGYVTIGGNMWKSRFVDEVNRFLAAYLDIY